MLFIAKGQWDSQVVKVFTHNIEDLCLVPTWVQFVKHALTHSFSITKSKTFNILAN